MFYNIPYEKLSQVRVDNIKTHSFVEKESKLLQYVRNSSLVNVDKAEMDFPSMLTILLCQTSRVLRMLCKYRHLHWCLLRNRPFL